MRTANPWNRFFSLAAAAALSVAFAACDTPTEEEPAPAEKSVEVTPQVAAALTTADAADGTADKTVSKCVTCALAMDGAAEHASTVGDFTLHLCSAECKTKFDSDPAKAILAAKAPGEGN